jgi:holo-[acyl-carrier protein] synthase
MQSQKNNLSKTNNLYCIRAIGTDIQDITKFNKIMCDTKFQNKIFTKPEIKYCLSKNKIAGQHFAVRFAAKESVRKSCSSANIPIPDFKEIEILNNSEGCPMINIIHPKTKYNFLLSMSHSSDYAIAFVILTI